MHWILAWMLMAMSPTSFAETVTDEEWAALAFEKAEDYALEHDWENALRFYQEAAAKHPDPSYRYQAAYAATQCRPPRWDMAVSLVSQNRDMQSLLLLAEVYRNGSRWDRALEALQRARALAPTDAGVTVAHARLSDARWQAEGTQSDARKAAQYYREALRQDPDAPWRGEVKRRLRELEHDRAGAFVNMTIEVMRAGEYTRAWRLLDRAGEIEPAWEEPHYWRGSICAIFEAYTYYDPTGNRSEHYWQQASSLPEAHLALARLYRSQGKWQQALSEARMASQEEPNWTPPLLLLGEIHQAREETPEARRFFERVSSLSPGSVEAEQAIRALETRRPKAIPAPQPAQNWEDFTRQLLMEHGPVINDPERQRKLEVILSRLHTANALTGPVPGVSLLASEARNAWSVPPNQLYITVGLIDFVDSESSLQPMADDVLAFVLAHEWTHLLQRDLERSQQMQSLMSELLAGESVPWVRLQSGLGRASEIYADRYGALLAYRAHYQPYAAIAWCEAMIREVGDTPQRSNHPSLLERRQLLEGYLEGEVRRAYALFDQGWQLFQAGKLESAVWAFEGYLSTFPNDAAALENLGILYFLRGVSALSSTPWSPWRLHHELQTEPEIEPFPSREVTLTAEARAWWERAERQAHLLLRLRPDSPAAYQILGDVALALGDFEHAEAVYQRGMGLAPTHTGLQNDLGVLYALRGKPERAHELWNNLVDLPAAIYNRGKLEE